MQQNFKPNEAITVIAEAYQLIPVILSPRLTIKYHVFFAIT